MLFFIGLFVALCIILATDLILSHKEIGRLREKIDNFQPSVVNVIHLGLKNPEVTTGLAPVTLSIRPDDFRINTGKLYEKLVEGLVLKKHPDTGTQAFCILDHAGIFEIVESKSSMEIKKALTRLLNNEDEDAIKRFLRIVADSVTGTEIAKM